MTPCATRRTVLLATGAAALAAGCGSDGGNGGDGRDGADGREGGGGGASSETAGQELISATDVPVGGGTVLPDEKIVVTQPREGDFKAFSAICTHAAADHCCDWTWIRAWSPTTAARTAHSAPWLRRR